MTAHLHVVAPGSRQEAVNVATGQSTILLPGYTDLTHCFGKDQIPGEIQSEPHAHLLWYRVVVKQLVKREVQVQPSLAWRSRLPWGYSSTIDWISVHAPPWQWPALTDDNGG